MTRIGLDVTESVRRMPVSSEYLLAFLATFPAPVSVGMEATLYWPWLHDLLDGAGYSSRVADARQLKLSWRARSKTDPIDARKLAELLRGISFQRCGLPMPKRAGGDNYSTGARFRFGNAPKSRTGVRNLAVQTAGRHMTQSNPFPGYEKPEPGTLFPATRGRLGLPT